MRNNRGEWEYRNPYDRDHYHFIRNSGLRPYDFEKKENNLDALVGWSAVVMGVVVYVGYFFMGWFN